MSSDGRRDHEVSYSSTVGVVDAVFNPAPTMPSETLNPFLPPKRILFTRLIRLRISSFLSGHRLQQQWLKIPPGLPPLIRSSTPLLRTWFCCNLTRYPTPNVQDIHREAVQPNLRNVPTVQYLD